MAYQELHCAGRGGLESYFKVIFPCTLIHSKWGLCVNTWVCGHGSGCFWFPGTMSQEILREGSVMLQGTLMCFYGSSGGSFFSALIDTATWGKASAVLVPTCHSDPTMWDGSEPARTFCLKNQALCVVARPQRKSCSHKSCNQFPRARMLPRLKWAEREYSSKCVPCLIPDRYKLL